MARARPALNETAPEINYPLVEDTRPAIYRAMKYWGKKPHNIWAQYIERYCPPDGIVQGERILTADSCGR